jgi:DnaJ-class molecular chaperone
VSNIKQVICWRCNGSGEGAVAEVRCSVCRGKGTTTELEDSWPDVEDMEDAIS